ncbi:MAG: potassium channel family protein [Sedimenticola sp.]
MKLTPLKVFFAYISVVLICAVIYVSVPEMFKDKITIGDGLYFSVVTITTLGYGDFSPISDSGKAVAAFEAFLGVVLMGLFLLSVSNQLIEKEERKRIDAAKENLKAQYRAWKRNVIYSLLFLSKPGKGVASDLAEELTDAHRFRDYFKEDNDARWCAIANNLSSDSYYSKEIVHGLENLQSQIEIFIASSRVGEAEVLKQLTQYVNHLSSMRRRDLDDYDDQKGFMRALWSVLAQWDFSSGDHNKDILLDTIDKI